MSERLTLENLGLMLKERRNKRSLRLVAEEIGTSAATLSRIESGKQPDIETFAKLCRWLEVDGGKILGCSKKEIENTKSYDAHFRVDRNLKPDTAYHLGELIIAINQSFKNLNS